MGYQKCNLKWKFVALSTQEGWRIRYLTMHFQVLNSKNKLNPKAAEEKKIKSSNESETKKITNNKNNKQLDLWEDKQELQTLSQSNVEEGKNTIRGEDGVITTDITEIQISLENIF